MSDSDPDQTVHWDNIAEEGGPSQPKRTIKIINRNAVLSGFTMQPVAAQPLQVSAQPPDLPHVPTVEPGLPKYYPQNGVPSSAIVDWIPPPPEGFTPVEFIAPVKTYPPTSRERQGRHRHHCDAVDSFSDKSAGIDNNNNEDDHKQSQGKFGKRLMEIMQARKAQETENAQAVQEKSAAGNAETPANIMEKKNYAIIGETASKNQTTMEGDNEAAETSEGCKKPEHKYKCYNLTLLPDFGDKSPLYIGITEWVRKMKVINWVESGAKEICGECENCFVEQAMAAFKIPKRFLDQKNIIRIILCTVYQTFKDGTDFYWAPEKAMNDMGVSGILNERIYSERLQAEHAGKLIKDYIGIPKPSRSKSRKATTTAGQQAMPKRKIVLVRTINSNAIFGGHNGATASMTNGQTSLTQKILTVDKIVADELAKAVVVNGDHGVKVTSDKQEIPMVIVKKEEMVDQDIPMQAEKGVKLPGTKQDEVKIMEADPGVPIKNTFKGTVFGEQPVSPMEHKFTFDVNAPMFVPKSPASDSNENITFKPRKGIKILRTVPAESIFSKVPTAASKRVRSPSSDEEEGVKVALNTLRPAEEAKKIRLKSISSVPNEAKNKVKEFGARDSKINLKDAKVSGTNATEHCLSILTEALRNGIKESPKSKVEKPKNNGVQNELKENKPKASLVDKDQKAKENTAKTASSGELTKEDLQEIFSKKSPVIPTIDITGDDKQGLSDPEEQPELHLKLGPSSSVINGKKFYGSQAIAKKSHHFSGPSTVRSQSSGRGQSSKALMANVASTKPTPAKEGLPTDVKEKALSQVAPALIDFVRDEFIPMLQRGEVKHEHHCNLHTELMRKMHRNVDEMDELQLGLLKRIAKNLDLFIQLNTFDCTNNEAELPNFSEWDPTEDIRRHLDANLTTAPKVRSNRSMHDPRYQRPDVRQGSSSSRGSAVNIPKNPPHLQGRNRSYGKFPVTTPATQPHGREYAQYKADKRKSSAPGSYLRGINLREQENKREWQFN